LPAGGRRLGPASRSGSTLSEAIHPPAAPSERQLEALGRALRQNPRLDAVLQGARQLELPDWYLAAGCIAQTVWNLLSGRAPDAGIRDYDLPYFDAADLSWAAEDRVIRAARDQFADLPAVVEVRNQARVHLWYQAHFGVPAPPYPSVEAAISTYPTTATSVGVRLEAQGSIRVFAPFGLTDLFGMVVRPNSVLAPRIVYEAKVRRYLQEWPELTVLPWPDSGPEAVLAPQSGEA